VKKGRLMATVALASLTLVATVAFAPLASATNRGPTPTRAAAASSAVSVNVGQLLAQARALLSSPAVHVGGSGGGDIVNATVATATAILNGVLTVFGVTFTELSEGVEPSSLNAASASQETVTLASETAAFAHYAGLTGTDAGATLSRLDDDLDLGIL
jgi:hypothetical protein